MENSSSKPYTKTIGFIILLFFVGWAALFAKNNWQTILNISIINPSSLAFLITLFVVNYFIIGLSTKVLLEPLHVRIGILESFGTAITTGFYNILTPFRGGMATRGYYLKTRHGLPYSSFLANVSADYIFSYWFGSIFGLTSLYAVYITRGIFSWTLIVFFLSVFLALTYIVVFAPRLKETRFVWANRFIRVLNNWHAIRANKTTLLKISFIIIVGRAASVISTSISFNAFGIDVSLLESLLITSISSYAKIVAITPAGLGINEAFLVFSAQLIDIPVAESLAVALLGRAIYFIGLLTLGPIASFFLYKKAIMTENEK